MQEREGVDPEQIAHVHLQDLLDRKEESEGAFCRSLAKLGFACLTLPSEDVEVLHQAYAVAKDFFASQRKKEFAMPHDKDVGYINMKRIKEFYQMRYSDSSKTLWPDYPSNFKEVSHQYYDLMFGITKTCLSTLARGIQVDEQKFLSLLDTEESREDTENYFSSTLFRYFHYKNKKSCDEEPCKTHTDIGLLTIIPATDAQQLLLLNSETFEWINVEKYCKKDVECVVFAGEMLERLTAYYYRAIIHRVGPPPIPQKRYSLVWLCRARPDALLDCVGLNSPIIGPIYWDFREPISVAEFMRVKYSSKESANGLNTQQVGGKGFPAANVGTPANG